MIYLIASNIEKECRIINGKGYGAPIDEIGAIFDKDIKTLKGNYFLLDNVSGDLFQYNNTHGEW